MSRIGKRPVVLEKGVAAKLEGELLVVKGPKGELKFNCSQLRYPLVAVKVADGKVEVGRREETRQSRMEQGLVRALIQNMAWGVAHGYTKILDVVGVGYKADLKGKILNLNLGFSHPIEYHLPEGIGVTVDKQTRITITGVDKKLVGEVTACIRRFRPPEPYKGKGVRYADEVVRRKVGKAAAAASSGG